MLFGCCPSKCIHRSASSNASACYAVMPCCRHSAQQCSGHHECGMLSGRQAGSYCCRLQQLLAATQQGLEKRDANLEVQQYVESVLLKQQTLYDSFMTTEAEKRRRLLEHVNSLEVRPAQTCTHMYAAGAHNACQPR